MTKILCIGQVSTDVNGGASIDAGARWTDLTTRSVSEMQPPPVEPWQMIP